MQSQQRGRMADFIRQNQAAIVVEWVDFARSLTPATGEMSKLALEDHIHEILNFIADDLESAQTARERFDKSRGRGPQDNALSQSAAEIHAALRLADGFDIDQMVAEYRALRASVVKQWASRRQLPALIDIDDLARFNEAIDQAITESVAHYTKTINNSRNLFLGVLGHDLRNPLTAVSMGAKWIEQSGAPSPKHAQVISNVRSAAGRATQILDDLLDLARSSFGTDIPIARTSMDAAALCQSIADETQAAHPHRQFKVTQSGDPAGSWDSARLGQALSNLMGNAVFYGDPSSPIVAGVDGTDPDEVSIIVHNLGPPIPAEMQKQMFQSGMRGIESTGQSEPGHHLGLGLYISKLIAEAHGGDISVASDETGTTFRLQLPRS